MIVLRQKSKALIIAGFITVLMITGIANLSYSAQQKSSVLDFDQENASCALSICILL
ncbi:hypothetical protein MNBD_ALPHA02-886 [hydrothermal vent metagenome]|uniref:Uncharacterized protein n=1 Tax=hydrothermal vent metagenome TaxID=652676 RepID=A0A3B0RL76_9ZZZZ